MSQPYEGQEQVNEEVQSGEVQSEAPSTNPAWDPVYEDLQRQGIPEPFINKFKEATTPHFKEWDSKYQELTTKYAPYKEFADNKIDPLQLTNGYNVFQALQNDPRGLFDRLGQHLGITPEQAQELVEEEVASEADGEYVDPTVKALADQVQQMQQAQYDKEFNTEVDRHGQIIDSQISNIKNQDPSVDVQQLFEIISARSKPNQAPMMPEQAYEIYKEREAYFRSRPAPGANTPRIMPGGGQAPAAQLFNGKQIGDLTKQEFKDYQNVWKSSRNT